MLLKFNNLLIEGSNMKLTHLARLTLFLLFFNSFTNFFAQTTQGLWALYKFEQNSIDSSGNGRSLSAPTNQAYVLDKNNDKYAASFYSNGSGIVTTSASLALPLTNSSFTIGFWFFVEDDASRGGYYEGNYGSSPYNRVILGKFGNGTIYAQLIDNAGTAITLSTPQQLNEWVRYDLTFDKVSKTLTFYKNGTQIGQSSNASFNNIFNETDWPGFSLANNPVNGTSMNGRLDEVRLYSRALSAAEILEIYNSISTYTIQASVNNSTLGSISPSGSVLVTSGTNKSFSTSATSGNMFDYFIVDNDTTNHITTTPYTFSNVTSNHSITAYFKPIPVITYTITASVADTSMGSISPVGVSTVNTGTNKQFTANPKSGYEFDYFVINDYTPHIGDNPYTFTNVTSNRTIVAYFKIAPPATVTITASVEDTTKGTIIPAGISTINYNGSKQFTALPKTDYEFDGFIIDNNNTTKIGDNPYTLTNVTSNKTIQATFKSLSSSQFTITPSVDDSLKGTITPAVPQVVHSGNSIQFIAQADSTHQFDYFLLDGNQIIEINPYTITNVHANMTIKAVFKDLGTFSSKVSGSEVNMYYNKGNVAIGTANIPLGYKFVVAGKVITEEVVVKLSDSWPDYVFNPQYTLTPLNEVENYINENKHLPEIPSASEIAEKGAALGDIQSKLLKKIEELTLYLIELKKENSEMKDRIKNLESKK